MNFRDPKIICGRTGLVILLFACCFNPSYVRAETARVITGTGSVRYYDMFDGNRRLVSERGFGLHLAGCRWRISTTNSKADDLGGRGIISWTAENDGTNVYFTRALNPTELTETKIRRFDNFVTNQIIVNVGDIPAWNEALITPVWLAYASSCYLDGISNGRVRKIVTMHESAFAIASNSIIAEIIRTNIGLHAFIKHIDFRNEGFTLISDDKGGSYVRHFKKPYNAGFIEATFDAFSFTTNGPNRFVIRFFGGVSGALSASQTRVVGEVEGNLELSEAAPDLDSVVVAERKSFVYDHRLKGPDGGPVFYLTTNEIYATNDDRMTRIRAHLEWRFKQTMPGHSRKPRLIAFVFGAAIILAGVSLWVVTKHLKGIQAQTKTKNSKTV